MMFFLRSLFRIREHLQIPAADGESVSFWEHLEDLRRMILRMLASVFMATALCSALTPRMLEVMLYPVNEVGRLHEQKRLPGSVRADDWQKAQDFNEVRHTLSPRQRMALGSAISPELRRLADATLLLCASDLLPQEKRRNFISTLAEDADTKELALLLMEHGVQPQQAHSRESRELMSAFRPGEAFMISLGLALAGGVALSAPLLVYFLLQFVVPGLHRREAAMLYRCLFLGFFLFIAGGCFAYFIVLPRVLSFFFDYSLSMGIANEWRIGYYLEFSVKLIVAFGAVFELPIILIPLVSTGILNAERLKKGRAYALIFCFAAALFLAPAPDPGTMLIMALPMYTLYEFCLWFAVYRQKRARRGM